MTLRMLFDESGVSVFSYRTIEGKLRYGNKIYTDLEKSHLLHEGSDFITEEAAKQDAENCLTDSQISDELMAEIVEEQDMEYS